MSADASLRARQARKAKMTSAAIAEEQEILQGFIVESRELLEECELQLIDLQAAVEESGDLDDEAINTIFRAFHSIKGSAGFLNLDSIARVTHETETLLDLFRQGKAQLKERHTGLFIRACDVIQRILDTVETSSSDEGLDAEVKALTESAKALQKADDELERRVEERTIMLAKSNKESQTEIAERKQAEETLQKAHDELERRVEERTTELAKSNKELRVEIAERKQAEESLQKREAELEANSHALEEANTSLRVLLRHVGEEKEKLEEEIITNVKKLIMPSIEGLKRSRLGAKERGHVNILATNLTDIISPFSRKLLSKYSNLTPKETQVANLVKEGKTNKEIAELLNVATSSIELHRHHIRKKLGLISKKVNLKSYLSSLP